MTVSRVDCSVDAKAGVRPITHRIAQLLAVIIVLSGQFMANVDSAKLFGMMVPLMAAIGVATFGSAYFACTATGGAVAVIRSFALLCGLFAGTSVAAGVALAYAMRGQRTSP
jgi:hypothetical protein